MYISLKVWPDAQVAPLMEKDFTDALRIVNLDYLDAYFIHWPLSSVPIEASLAKMKYYKIKAS